VQTGLKKITFLKAGLQGTSRSLGDRVIGYQKALKEAGRSHLEYILPFDEVNDISMQKFFAAMNHLMSDIKTDAIIMPYDGYVALGIRYLRAHGYRVPEDVILIGFDNTAEGRTEDWPTTNPDFSVMGERAAELLLDQTEGASKNFVEIVLPVPIIHALSNDEVSSGLSTMIDKVVSNNPIGVKTETAAPVNK